MLEREREREFSNIFFYREESSYFVLCTFVTRIFITINSSQFSSLDGNVWLIFNAVAPAQKKRGKRTTALEFRRPYVGESTPCEAGTATVKNLCSLLANLPNRRDRGALSVCHFKVRRNLLHLVRPLFSRTPLPARSSGSHRVAQTMLVNARRRALCLALF